eukprot:13566265-Alexandrium_andersonii.AAC.1
MQNFLDGHTWVDELALNRATRLYGCTRVPLEQYQKKDPWDAHRLTGHPALQRDPPEQRLRPQQARDCPNAGDNRSPDSEPARRKSFPPGGGGATTCMSELLRAPLTA